MLAVTCLGATMLMLVTGLAAAGDLNPSIVTDPLTGVAIFGYDPVSYFTGNAPQPGRPDYEYDWQGVPWYFASAANRDVFVGNPGVYAPRFGGHGAMSLARGFLSDGNPHVYIVFRNRLYLFFSPGNRDAFILSGTKIIGKADAAWQSRFPPLAAN